MKSPYKNIEIDYWTYPDGKDFNGIEDFISEIDKDYFLTVTKKRTDALGGGLYDLIIEISEDLTLLELAKSYVEDGVKLYVGYNIKRIYESVKKLFEKNQDFHPSVEKIKIKFKDCTIYLYEVYQNESEQERLFSKLSENGTVTMPLNNYGFSQRFGWVIDQFGVSWQLNLK